MKCVNLLNETAVSIFEDCESLECVGWDILTFNVASLCVIIHGGDVLSGKAPFLDAHDTSTEKNTELRKYHWTKRYFHFKSSELKSRPY